MSQFSALFSEKIQGLQQQGLHRTRQVLPVDGTYLHFCSNDYLSLSNDRRVKKAYQQGFEYYPAGSGGSGVICGYHPIHAEFEQTIAAALATDAAMVFGSGYAANLAVVNLLSQLERHLLVDKAIHASFYDGMKLADARFSRYRSNDTEDLRQKLAHTAQAVVVTEGLFSMSGQVAPLQDISHLCETHEVPCLVDEAHSFGVMGEHGLGAVRHFSLTQEQIPLRIITFGKAFGGQGALVAGCGDWVDALVQYARPYLYSTAISPALVYGLLKTFQLIYDADDRRRQLEGLVRYFREKAAQSPLRFADSMTAIQQLQLGCPHAALNYAQELSKRRIFCQAIREPTVPRKYSGLRMVLNCRHEAKDIDHLFNELHAIYDTEHSN
ncbi:8-amino-7-oxononanoate synthase [Legionella rubrilucens]|uniref:8-amino-7-oxononanoate synthase n=1 Tax=Legionella rubrilucens TaxID=458 RepID=A0A0W0XXK5_9GAMM|nr:8-amino-7-oxononanoate synthase [Legionella rubrilucens]KTD49419.1 8-amino-7-oxononanoate synthase [Legionella rubrilucens]